MVTLDDCKTYLRLDDDSQDTFVQQCLDGAIVFVKKFTGLDDIDSEDLNNAILCLVADMFEVRQATVNGVQLNPYVEMILNMNQRNLL